MNRLVVPLLTSAGLLGGFGVARATGVRAAGGGVLGAVGVAVFALVARRGGAWRATAVLLAYLGAFGGSHPLAKRLGAWPSVVAVAAATAVPAALLAER
ncbi:hypothetical protein [Amnibacterium kyonggiense]|uniref:Uncharacterized protein n=1 Tax=Amnibacterium kyonggiense TaxID=595671 RepID=A0A4R7FKN6_9MICO|nr:hypothetical protein [Amnibacterium kyonggiense]TDS76951.1 hypothetical protein CLV52_1890 [Amnibacterium kyonggiense]